MSPPHRHPSILLNILWAVTFAVTLPASLAATRICEVTFDQVTQPAARRVARGNLRVGNGMVPFLFRTVVLSALFIVVDESAGLDILYRTLGLDILPKTPVQLARREHRAIWRQARASGDAAQIRETFFRLRREQFDMMGVRYEEEPVQAPSATTGASAELLDPQDVRVFFILSKWSASAISKIYVAFNADPDELGVRDKLEATTKWILARQIESKVAEHRLDMPCNIERVYQDRSEGELLLKWSRNGGGSSNLADVWDRNRPRFVAEDGTNPAE